MLVSSQTPRIRATTATFVILVIPQHEEPLVGQTTTPNNKRALGAELSEHLGYEKADPAGRGTGNSLRGQATQRRQGERRPVSPRSLIEKRISQRQERRVPPKSCKATC